MASGNCSCEYCDCLIKVIGYPKPLLCIACREHQSKEPVKASKEVAHGEESR